MLAPLVLAGCDLDPPADPDRPAHPTGPAASPPADDDTGLVREVIGALDTAAAVVAAAAAGAGSQATALAELAAVHDTHRTLLSQALPDEEASATPVPLPDAPGGRRAAMAAVRRAERQLSRTLLEACLASGSGDLARVLASAHAGVAQHVAALSRAEDDR